MAPPVAAAATRIAAHWVLDALAGDEDLDFSVIKGKRPTNPNLRLRSPRPRRLTQVGYWLSLSAALVGASPECLTGAPGATRERVALRCLQEVASVATEGDPAAAARALRVDAARSCEDVLLELIAEAGSSGILEKDMLPPFSRDIQNMICIKKTTLPESSFELLKEVDPEIASVASPSQLEQNDNNQHDNSQSVCSSQCHENIENPGVPPDNTGLQQDNVADLTDETDIRNRQKDPNASTSVVPQQCGSDSRSPGDRHEDASGARSPETSLTNVEGDMSAEAVPASASCDAVLSKSITEPLRVQDTNDHSTMVQQQSCREKSPSLPHCISLEKTDGDDTSNQSLKDPNRERLSTNATVAHSQEGLRTDATVAPPFDRVHDDLPTNASEPGHFPEFVTTQDTTIVSQLHCGKTQLSALQHENVEKENQGLDNVSASIQPVERDHVTEELTLQAASVLPSVSCNGTVQGGKSETKNQPGNATERTILEQQNADKSHPEISCADKVSRALHDDGIVLEKNTVHSGLNLQTDPVSQNCNISLSNKISEANDLSEQNTGKNKTDAQKHSCGTFVSNSTQVGNGKSATKTPNQSSHDSLSGAAAAILLSMTDKMPFCTMDQDTNDSLEGLSQQDLCIKCGKDGQLLKCSGCLLAAHDSCFSSSVTFDETGTFYCPICFYTKATEAYQKARKTYCEARKNLAAFLGTTELTKQHGEQQIGVPPRAANGERHLNGRHSSRKRNSQHDEAGNLTHYDEQPDQQGKKQKINATSNGYPDEVITEKASPVRDSDIASMNNQSVLDKNISKQVQNAEQMQQVENKEARKEAGSGNSSHETGSSQNRCGPSPANQEVEADKDNGIANSHQSNDSDEIEATSSDNSGKRSSPPWRNMRHRKAKLQGKETAAPSNYRKTTAQQDQNIPSPARKRNYAYPQKRYSNPVASTGRRTKLSWTEEEEVALRDAMQKFTPRDGGPIPWVQILEYRRDVFHKTRLPCDLRVKWRNLNKKACS
ncbi:hypothetical protein ACP4OV_012238 [Aristida adscensionis]